MVNICNVSIDCFLHEVVNKYLFFYGAGIRAKRFLENFDVEDSLVALIDNNEKLQGKVFCNEKNKNVRIISLDQFRDYILKFGINNIALLITPVFYSMSILEKLNKMYELEGLKCYIGELLLNFYEEKKFDFVKGELFIPKKIHYCWFGKNEIPEKLQYCIDTWKKKCPDYEIIRWDEENYDITKNRYMREAYECKKWGFVPDYARLDIIYNEGGIYLDTDVELVDNLDRLLSTEAFFGCAGELNIALGLGFGAIKEHNFIKELRDVYEKESFYNNDGSMNLRPCTYYQHPVFQLQGFNLRNEYQYHNNIAIYPSEVLSPLGIIGGNHNFTKKTIAVHHGSLSWITEKEFDDIEKYRKYIKDYNLNN